MEFELPKINVSFEYDEEKDEMVFVINGVEKRVKTEDMITEMEKLQEQNTALEQQPCEDCISRKAVLDLVEDMTDQFGVEHRVITEGVISMLPPVTPKTKTDVLAKIRAEIEQVKSIMNEEIINHDRKDLINFVNGLNQSLAIIDKYKAESENKE